MTEHWYARRCTVVLNGMGCYQFNGHSGGHAYRSPASPNERFVAHFRGILASAPVAEKLDLVAFCVQNSLLSKSQALELLACST